MIRVLDARFLTTAVDPPGWPAPSAPEVAFVGRSNVSKSSMINTLTGRRKLVRVSNTPGRTRTLNFFGVDLAQGEERRQLLLADLPGYGFAKVSKTERAGWEEMITAYLRGRTVLCAVVAIVDAEVVPVKRVRGNRKAFQEFVDALDSRTSDVPTLHIGIAHADAPERMLELEKMVRDRRPQAQIEAEAMLGAVVGTHSGPGCVGFFWFDDVEAARRAGFEIGVISTHLAARADQNPLLTDRVNAWTDSLASFAWGLARLARPA